MRRFVPTMAAAVLAFLFAVSSARAAEYDVATLAGELRPLFSCVAGQREAFCISVQAKIAIDGKPQQVDARLVRYDNAAFDLELKHPQYAAHFRRRADAIAFAVPYHKVVFIGRG